MLSNVNLSRERERKGRERFQADIYGCERVIPNDNLTREREEEGGLGFMYVLFNVNLEKEGVQQSLYEFV